jgi:hypothetical protein
MIGWGLQAQSLLPRRSALRPRAPGRIKACFSRVAVSASGAAARALRWWTTGAGQGQPTNPTRCGLPTAGATKCIFKWAVTNIVGGVFSGTALNARQTAARTNGALYTNCPRGTLASTANRSRSPGATRHTVHLSQPSIFRQKRRERKDLTN